MSILTLIVAAALAAPGDFRKWTDATGTHTIEAKFESAGKGKVRLKRVDGTITEVPLPKLSAADREYILRVTEPAERSAKPVASRPIAKLQSKRVTAAIELPEHGSTDEVKLDLAGDEVTLELALPPNCPCDLQLKSPEFGASWNIVFRNQPVAKIARNPRELTISWDKDCPIEAECLRNVVLIARTDEGSQAFSLRTAVEIDPPFVDLVNRSTAVPIDMPLFGLQPKDLKLEVSGFLDGREAKARFPGNGRVDHGDEVRLLVRNDPPQAAIKVLVSGYEQPVVRLEPVFVDFNGKRQQWTDKHLKRLRTAFINDISRHEREIPKAENLIPKLQSELSALRSQFNPKAVNADFVLSAIDGVQAKLNKTRNNLEIMRRNLPELKKRFTAFSKLFELSEGIHQQWKVGYRIFYVAGEHEVTLVQMKLSS